MFFAAVYTSSSLVLGAVFSVVSVSVLSTPCLPPALALGMSPLLASETTLDLYSMVVELGFVPAGSYIVEFDMPAYPGLYLSFRVALPYQAQGPRAFHKQLAATTNKRGVSPVLSGIL